MLPEDFTSGLDEDLDDDELDPDDPEHADVIKRREIDGSEDWLALPDKFEIDEYRVMRDYCGTLADKLFSEDLYNSIGGRGTFQRFKGMLERRNLLNNWYEFRSQAFTEIARNWLEENEIEFGP